MYFLYLLHFLCIYFLESIKFYIIPKLILSFLICLLKFSFPRIRLFSLILSRFSFSVNVRSR